MRKQVVMVVILMLMAVWPVTAQDSAQVRATWNPPTTGSPVVMYTLEVLEDGMPFVVAETPDTTYVFTAQHGVPYVARVLGTDDQDRDGPWSLWSDPFVFDAGPPGGCGAPRLEVVGDKR